MSFDGYFTLWRAPAIGALPLLGALLACGGGAMRPRIDFVNGPNGAPAMMLTCSSASQCYEVANRSCPNGFALVDNEHYSKEEHDAAWEWLDAAGGCGKPGHPRCHDRTTRVEVREMLIQCKPREEAAHATTRGARAAEVPQHSAPQGGVGYAFGSTLSQCQVQCERQGHDFTISGSRARCSGLPQTLGFEGRVWFGFSSQGLSDVEVIIDPGETARATVNGLQASLESRYGQPSTRDVQLPDECFDDLAGCLSWERARYILSWDWKTGARVLCDLYQQRGTPYMRVSYQVDGAKTAETADW